MTFHTNLIHDASSIEALPIVTDMCGYDDYLNRSRVSVVVPCYNEEHRLDGDEFIDFAVSHSDVEFVFVNDGSTDGTLNLLEGLKRRLPDRIEVVSLSKNSGKAEAVRAGLQFASSRQSCFVAYWDADLATPLSAILDFRDIAQRYRDVDVVFGSRMQLLGHRINRTLMRRTVSRVCSGLARLAVRLPVRDTQCGAKLLRNTPALQSSLKQEFTAGWLFDVELFSRLSSQVKDRNKAFFEYPLAEWTEVAGSKVSGKVIFKSGLKMLSLIAATRLNFSTSKGQVSSAPMDNVQATV